MQVAHSVACSRPGFENCNQGGQVTGEWQEAASFNIQPGVQNYD